MFVTTDVRTIVPCSSQQTQQQVRDTMWAHFIRLQPTKAHTYYPVTSHFNATILGQFTPIIE